MGLPVAVFALFIGFRRLRLRLAALEAALPDAKIAPRPPLAAPGAAPAAVDPEPDPSLEPEAAASPLPGRWARPRAFVFRKDLAARLTDWLARNWFLAVAALSLMLSGVFLVQYGIEQGLLTPFWRVAGAALLGSALVAAGEWVRRRASDEDGHTAALPSTFAGAGLVVLAVAALSARHLYGLIGAEAAFAATLGVAALAVALGWFYGPFLSAAGLLGALAVPFVTGGSSDTPEVFFAYTAVIVLAGLLIDAVRRWAWVSVLALAFGHAAAWLYFVGGAGDTAYLGFALFTALAAVAVPPLRWRPRHDGPAVTESVLQRGQVGWPEFPTRLAFGAFVAALAAVGLVAVKDAGPDAFWAAIAAASVLYAVATVWMRDAPALEDLAAWAALALVAAVVWQGADPGTVAQDFRNAAGRLPELPPPRDATGLAALGLGGSALAFWRSRSDGPWRVGWAALAAVLAPAVLVALELWWQPRSVLGAGPWALHVMATAAAMTLFAERAARADGEDRRRVGLFAMSTLSLIAFALVLLLTDTALTVALALLILLAALLDRWQRLPLLSFYIHASAAVIGWRLIAGLALTDLASRPLWEISLAYLGAILPLGMAWAALAPLRRAAALVVLESAVWTLAAVYIALMIGRLTQGPAHAELTLAALVWVAALAGQLWRLQAGGRFPRLVRLGLAMLYFLVAAALLAAVAVFENPLLSSFAPVAGPPVFDSLLVAFGLPALAFIAIAWKMPHLHRLVRWGFAALVAVYGAAWVALEIRRLWRGRDLTVPGTTDPELYSYTLAMLAASVALLFVAFARRSITLRRAAMLGIALTIAKVYLIDMAGLAGLARVASFLGLGLSLAALAWVNRIMTDRWGSGPPDTPAARPKPEADGGQPDPQ